MILLPTVYGGVTRLVIVGRRGIPTSDKVLWHRLSADNCWTTMSTPLTHGWTLCTGALKWL